MPNHMIEGFIQGPQGAAPALFNLYTSCQPEHGIGDDKSFDQAKLAVESRAYPIFRYNPDEGPLPEECFDLDGNPSMIEDWPTYTLKYREGGVEKSMELPMTFADFAMTEIRFRKHFRMSRRPTPGTRTWCRSRSSSTCQRTSARGLFPYLWSVESSKQQLTRLLVAEPMVRSCEDRREFWTMLRAIARSPTRPRPSTADLGAKGPPGRGGSNSPRNLMQLDRRGNDGEAGAGLAAARRRHRREEPGRRGRPGRLAEAGVRRPGRRGRWITWRRGSIPRSARSCDECINLNPKIFALQRGQESRHQGRLDADPTRTW